MTTELMHLATKQELSKLSILTKRELIAYFNNIAAIVTGHADNVAAVTKESDTLDAAIAISKTGRRFSAEIEALFAERNPDNKGATEKA